ncbi:MAG: cobaltochelatase subunit CobN [Methylotenera sp.]|nr:cobaltochelatase subunit CobN [Methylotenera sp.]MDD4925014.1 cobaltochelatase subunit CobN [Methylotenera sp.]
MVILFSASVAMAADKVALLSTSFVLERKFQLLEQAAIKQGMVLAWVQVDKASDGDIANALKGVGLVIIDAPRSDDQAVIERFAGKLLRNLTLPTTSINTMSQPRTKAVNQDAATSQRLFEYYIAGTQANHERLFQYIKVLLHGGDLTQVPPPIALPNGGIYHPAYKQVVFDNLPDYLTWWEKHAGKSTQQRPIIGMETSSSYLSDGQARMLDETIAALEKAGAVPIVFYRSTRLARAQAAQAKQESQARETEQAVTQSGRATTGTATATGRPARNQPTEDNPLGFPNPKETQKVEVNEPLITQNGKVILNVLLVNTFLGGNPDRRKAWHQAMGIPVINILSYRSGTRADYMKDNAGVSSFMLPFTLTTSEYIGMQDPVLLMVKEDGELVTIPEQMDMLVGKAINLAKLQTLPNEQKKVALLFWNHPPGEKNQGASNMNVPRSIEHLVNQLRAEGYVFDTVDEQRMIATVGKMLRPAYRKGGLVELMQTPHWDFLPLAEYKRWYSTLPETVRRDVEKSWGAPESSASIATKNGVKGFVIPRMKLGNLVVMPQPSRGEMASDEKEKKLFHDTKMPLGHSYMAGYLWIREQLKADAIIHFGTHGSQEWSPGKERGLWAFDYPNILVGNVPIIYPYIVDNIGEAIHVKRRGRGIIVSYQTPAFAPAGLSDDFVKINDLIREYQSLDQGLVKDNNRKLIVEQAVKMNIHKDLNLQAADLERDFDKHLRDIEDYLEELGSAQQPLGLHTLGKDAEQTHLVSNVMQMLGHPLYDALGIKNAKALFRDDYRNLAQTASYQFVLKNVFSDKPLSEIEDAKLRTLAEKGRKFLVDLHANWETEAVSLGLSARWIDPSYGGDPIRNPDALHTGRNMYGFDPSRVPTKAAYEAGKQAMEQLIVSHQATHGKFPEKLAFTMWSTETMRHLGMLEAEIMFAMGVRPQWDEGGRVIGMEVIPQKELGRPRIDTVISLTGLYRDQFPNVMERFNEAIVMVAAMDEEDKFNFVRANTTRIKAQLIKQGIAPEQAEEFALTRVFGNESGDYSTRLTNASLASDQWREGDGQLEKLYLARMSWAYGPNTANWSKKLADPSGQEINAYAEHLKGTSAAVFSRSSNLKGLLDTDHPFEFLGGISMAVRYLDGKSPQLYISNMRDPKQAKLETAEKFMAKELRAVYQHPHWMAEMQKEGYSGTLQMLNTINNFWGWQVMDRNIVRDDQWQEFHETYVKDRYKLGTREWFEKSNPTALAQIAERMLEAIRKDYWKADEQTKRELVQVYQEIAQKHDVHTNNETFKAYVKELSHGYGVNVSSSTDVAKPKASAKAATQQPQLQEKAKQLQPKAPDVVRGQEMREVERKKQLDQLIWIYVWMIIGVILAGIGYQAWRTRRAN